MFSKRRALLISVILFAFSMVSVRADDVTPGFCHDYADQAVAAQFVNLRFNCGFMGKRWDDVWATHNAWCIEAGAVAKALHESAMRHTALEQCASQTSTQ